MLSLYLACWPPLGMPPASEDPTTHAGLAGCGLDGQLRGLEHALLAVPELQRESPGPPHVAEVLQLYLSDAGRWLPGSYRRSPLAHGTPTLYELFEQCTCSYAKAYQSCHALSRAIHRWRADPVAEQWPSSAFVFLAAAAAFGITIRVRLIMATLTDAQIIAVPPPGPHSRGVVHLGWHVDMSAPDRFYVYGTPSMPTPDGTAS